MIKFFFMANMRATLEGRPQYEFNSVTAMAARNVTAADLTRIQQAAADMLAGNVQFDDIVITNLFFLAECTEEQFFAGVAQPQPTEAPAPEGLEAAVADSLATAQAEAGELLAEADASAEAEDAERAVDAKAEVEETEAKAEDDTNR